MKTDSPFNYKRRKTSPVKVGNLVIGGDAPIRVQSMTSTSTMDVAGSVAQAERIIKAGGELVRLTAQGVREAQSLGVIRSELRAKGIETPLVADIHFNPRAAFAAAVEVEKVRINPGNFVDPGRTFRQLEYTDEEYAEELERIDREVTPFLELCRKNNTAIRIGVNHGSLSDRIMSRFGDTPAGMVESAMEYLRICKKRDFNNVVISIKASNTVVMVETVRRLVVAMEKEDMDYPLHLGVTEAGDGEDGRIKSAVGIGTLLAEGIGDTIRVSLSEEPECEIPVARELLDYIGSVKDMPEVKGGFYSGYDPVSPVMPDGLTVVAADDSERDGCYAEGRTPDLFVGDSIPRIDAVTFDGKHPESDLIVLYSSHPSQTSSVLAACHRLKETGYRGKTIVELSFGSLPYGSVVLRAAASFGRILLNGFADGIKIEASELTPEQKAVLSFNILQAARRRFTKTEFISCPSCGRTLFDLQSTLAVIKARLSHLKGLKIGVMGCIVNGPGEMADADYGYVGAAAGKVSLYRGKECIEKNIPASEALGKLINILKEDGKWIEPGK